VSVATQEFFLLFRQFHRGEVYQHGAQAGQGRDGVGIC
jgi:hypothetical protein